VIVVVGAGRFGMAIAHTIARNNHSVTLLSRHAERVIAINSAFTIPDYPMVKKPSTLRATTEIDFLKTARGVVLALPTQQIRMFLDKHASLFFNIPLLLLQKGIEKETGLLPSEIAALYIKEPVSILSGPNFADEILMEVPTTTVIASTIESSSLNWATLLKSNTFRPYVQSDIIGVQIGGAIKNVVAIACGVVKGLGLGENTMAAIITRGLAEMVRLGLAMGAKKDTFLGLSGIGDLTLTCHGEKSRNFQFGMALAREVKWEESSHGTVEGYHTAFSLENLSKTYKVEMPISECVLRLIRGQLKPKDTVLALMERDLKQELF